MNPTNQSPQLLAEALARKLAKEISPLCDSDKVSSYISERNKMLSDKILQSIPIVELLELRKSVEDTLNYTELPSHYYSLINTAFSSLNTKLNQLLGEQK